MGFDSREGVASWHNMHFYICCRKKSVRICMCVCVSDELLALSSMHLLYCHTHPNLRDA